jgi:23S rRNA (adenine-N6)-dimethyltransferase
MPAHRSLPRHRLAANPSGVHLLRCRRTIASLIASSGVGPGDLVLDLGAGPGTITGPLAATGSTVVAVERDAEFVAALHARFDRADVRVVHADVRAFPLPRRPFAVVSSIPFAVTTPLLRRLLTPATGHLTTADLIVEWGLAKRLTAARPRDLETAWWASRNDLTIMTRVPADRFAPPPATSAAHLRVRRHPLPIRTQAILWTVLSHVYRNRAALHGLATPRQLRAAGIDPTSTTVPMAAFRRIAELLARDRAVTPPRLPRHLLR